MNARLRRLVAEERKSLQQVLFQYSGAFDKTSCNIIIYQISSLQLRLTYAQELKTRTEMEMLLRKCVDDVRQDIAEMYVHDYVAVGLILYPERMYEIFLLLIICCYFCAGTTRRPSLQRTPLGMI